MKKIIKTALALTAVAIAAQAAAQVTFYEREGFQGESFTTRRQIADFGRFGFNDRASSVVVAGEGPERWQVCEDVRFGGACVVLRPGQYPTLRSMGLNNRISSVRVLGRDGAGPESRSRPGAVYDPRRRDNEALFEADVTAVRAVVGAPEQRCWVDRDQVAVEPSRSNLPGVIVGAVIGGILGHQVGNGRGRDLATVGGAVAGGAIGASVGRDGQPTQTQDVQRCTTVPSQVRADLWDVTYIFRGQEHRVQMTSPPGATIIVNRDGEPRV